MSKQIGLLVPAREKATKGSFEVKPRKVEQWISTLPKANLGETARQVFRALVETNRLDLHQQERACFLDTLREPVKYVTEGMRKHFVGSTFPLPEKGQKVAAVTQKIYLEMAIGYSIAAEDLLKHNLIFPDTKLLTILIHRAISMYGRFLLGNFQSYAPYQTQVWEQIHRLYAYAENKRLLRTAVYDMQRTLVPKSTIADEYKRLLLLSLASPYCLRHGEIDKVYVGLEQWAPQVDLRELAKPDSSVQGFITNLDSDSPPGNQAIHTNTETLGIYRSIETHALIETLRREILNASDITTTTITNVELHNHDIPHSLLRKLVMLWNSSPRRIFSRTRKSESVQIAMGLSFTHQLISNAGRQPGNKNKPDKYFRPANFESVTIEGIDTPKPDVWDMIYAVKSAPKPLVEVTSETDTPVQPSTECKPENWDIVNESAGGYCLASNSDQTSKLQVGEILGIRRTTDSKSWKWGIGVVRWLKFSEHRMLMIGVEMLTPDAAAVGIRIENGETEVPFQRTLMLPELVAINKPSTLVTPPVPYREGSKITVNILGKEMKIQLTRLLENTGLFAQFQFDMLDVPQNKSFQVENKNPTQSDDAIDFANVWSSI